MFYFNFTDCSSLYEYREKRNNFSLNSMNTVSNIEYLLLNINIGDRIGEGGGAGNDYLLIFFFFASLY